MTARSNWNTPDRYGCCAWRDGRDAGAHTLARPPGTASGRRWRWPGQPALCRCRRCWFTAGGRPGRHAVHGDRTHP
jgi:hypothetical protein